MSKKILIILMLLIVLSLIPIVEATNAMIVYRSNTGACAANPLNCPKVREWNSATGTWGAETELATAGSPIRFVRIAFSPVSGKLVIITQSDDALLDAYVSNDGVTWTVTNNIGDVAASTQRRFDVEFETATGDAIVVYGVSSTSGVQDLAYKVLPANTLSFSGIAEQYIDDTTSGAGGVQYGWIALDRNPATTSQELIVVGADISSSDINAWVWDGSTWGNQVTLSTIGNTGAESIAVRYAADGSKGMVISADGTAGNFVGRYWNGTGWTVADIGDITAGNNDVQWVSLKADPASDDLMAVAVDNGNDLHALYWNGAVWSATLGIDTAVDSSATRVADFAWDPSGSTGRLVWDTDGAGNTLSYRNWTGAWSGTSTISTYVGTGSWIQMKTNPTDADSVNILGGRLNSNNDIGSFNWTGAAFFNYGDSAMTADTTTTTYEAFEIEFVTLDRVRPPSITFVSPTPVNNSNLSASYVYVNASVVDSQSNISAALLEWNGTTNYTMTIVGTGKNVSAYYNVTNLNDGVYTYRVYANDSSGNLNVSERRTVTIDTTPPAIDFVSPTPANNTLQNYNYAYINVSVVDTLVSVDSALLEWNGTNESMTKVGTGLSVSFYKNKTGLVDGTYTYKVYANDSAGNTNVSETRTLRIDATPPAVAIFLPANNAIVSGTQTIKANVTDPTSGASAVYANVSNASAFSTYTMSLVSGEGTIYNGNWSNASFDTTQFADGRYNVTINATDYAGNSNATVYVSIVINNTYPSVSFVSPTPANQSITDNDWVYVNVTINEDDIDAAFLEWNGTNYTMSGSGANWYRNHTLSGQYAGNYTYRVWVSDSAATWAKSETRVVTVKGRIVVYNSWDLTTNPLNASVSNATMLKLNLTAYGENATIFNMTVKMLGNYYYGKVNVSLYWDRYNTITSHVNSTPLTIAPYNAVLLAGPSLFENVGGTIQKTFTSFNSPIYANVSSNYSIVIVYDVAE